MVIYGCGAVNSYFGSEMESTTFDTYLVGTQKTYSEVEHENIIDSATAATVMASGVKTYNVAISVDNDKMAVKTVLEQAKEQGKSTRLVATAPLTHAIPGFLGLMICIATI
ncbi:hypothetical protein ABE51_30445 [Bacillus thuringiensis]|uniref:Alkaline phosphatase 3 n=1 Tax=Bacillus thuringiensis Bt18247 TaxID=1423143 RepID=A0A9W3SZ91_BACTU|nr:alkaline phosphatase 3 [Bacillus thuringiensis Bt18247]MBG9529334.1 hypothetical protein [Bacillus thuringiensis]